MIRVDLDALLRGVPLEGDLCEIAGYGPVPVSVIEDLLATESPFIIGLLTRGQALTGVYHHGRHPNAHQKSALDFLYPTCAAEGCPPGPGSNTTIARISPAPRSPPSTCSTGCVVITTGRKPTKAGP